VIGDLLEPARSVAVVGLAKNAGKTTVLNHLLRELGGRPGLASLGLDGEQRDQLTGLAKPRVVPPAGSLVAPAEELAGGLRVRRRLGMRTAVGEVVLVEAAGDVPVLVSGPATLPELDRTVEALFEEGIGRVLLEGALGRLGPAAPGRAAAVVLAAGASLAAGLDDYRLKLRLALDALDLPVSGEPAGMMLDPSAGYEREAVEQIHDAEPAVVELRGALTGPLLEGLLRAGDRLTLVVSDATRVIARPQQVARARRAGLEVAVRSPLAIACVTTSPFHPDLAFDADQVFEVAAAEVAGRWPVEDVVSGMIAG
jgi:hypothetical protein